MLRQQIKSLSFKTFLALDRLGLHVLPKHYYTPLPDYTWLAEHPKAWKHRVPLTGIDWDLDKQLAWVKAHCAAFYSEVATLDSYRKLSAQAIGPGFGPIESQVLHCFMRAAAPPKVVEIGSGLSTACMLGAVELNRREGKTVSEITCIEPFPREVLKTLPGIKLVEEPCQTVAAQVFSRLEKGICSLSIRAMRLRPVRMFNEFF